MIRAIAETERSLIGVWVQTGYNPDTARFLSEPEVLALMSDLITALRKSRASYAQHKKAG